MDPPLRPSSARQKTATQSANLRTPSTTEATVGSFASKTSPTLQQADAYHAPNLPAGQEWIEVDDGISSRSTRLQIELAECVETKIVTTTTTTKRSYPPLLVRPPRSLHSLNAKEYPLASKKTPQELASFSYEIDGKVVLFREDDQLSSQTSQLPKIRPDSYNHRLGTGRAYETPNTTKSIKFEQPGEDGAGETPFHRLSRAQSSPESMGKLPNDVHRRLRLQRDEPTSLYGPRLKVDTSDRHKSTLLSTPDPSDFESTSHSNPFKAGATHAPFASSTSPPPMPAHMLFPSAVATPPIADTDLEPFDDLSDTSRDLSIAQILSNAGQNASLPSPGLSPTLGAASINNLQLPLADDEDSQATSEFSNLSSRNSQESSADLTALASRRIRDLPRQRSGKSSGDRKTEPTVSDIRSMFDAFDSMPSEMKTFMMYQFLRRCPRKTLNTIAGVVNPALKCDFLDELPLELSLQILSFLDHKDLCRAAQVSKSWRNIIDSNETGWKELLDRDQYALPTGELERAIIEGWGWQDPYGVDGCELDLSVHPNSDGDSSSVPSSKSTSVTAVSTSRQAMKRKRQSGSHSADRAKRRALASESKEKLRSMGSQSGGRINRQNKSEGPNAAATAAALAVPDPQMGLPSLRKLHLFKSLYRRHHMLHRNWMNKEVKPHHMAFPAHPRHVITCLQFDDDKILTGSDDTFIHVYDTKTGALRRRLEGHDGGVWALEYQGNTLVSGSTDRSVRVWDIEKGVCTQVFHGHTSTVRCLQILMPSHTGQYVSGKPIMMPEKPLIITGSRDSQLRVWRLPEQGSRRYLQNGPPINDTDCPYFVRVLQGHSHSVRAIAAHEDTLVSGSYDCSVRVWKISTGETVHQLRGHGQKVYSVVLDNLRKRCISGSMDNSVKIWSLETGACIYTLEGHTSLVGLLDLQDDRLVSAAADSTLRIWDPENGQCKNTLTAHTGAITCFQHDSSKVVSGSDRTLKMWNVRTGECLQDLLSDLSGVWQVKFDERRCVAAVQRDGLTYIEVLDFGASRDGISASERGRRISLPPADVDRLTDDEEFVT